MALPPLDCNCEPCCRRAFDVAAQVRDLAFAAVLECAGDECCEGMSAYVAHGPIHGAPLGDYVAVWVESYGFVARSGFLIRRARLAVKLMESGWPTIQTSGSTVVVPSPEQIEHASKHLLGHAEALFGAIVGAAQAKEFGCGFVEVSDLTPVQPTTNLAGYQFSITVNLS